MPMSTSVNSSSSTRVRKREKRMSSIVGPNLVWKTKIKASAPTTQAMVIHRCRPANGEGGTGCLGGAFPGAPFFASLG